MVCPGFQSSEVHKPTSGEGTCPAAAGTHKIRQELEGLPLGPDSLLWNYFDNRMALVPATGIKQLMMLDIDAGIEQHSQFFTEIVERTFRSMVKIGGAVFDLEHGDKIGRGIRDQHVNIKGINTAGDRYHAMHPKLWADTHLTFADGVYEVAERFDGHELTSDEHEILWMEMITWYHKYGVSDRYLPSDYAAYKERSDEMAEEYVLTATARRALEYAVKGNIPRPNAVPAPFWWMLKTPIAKPTTNFLGAVVISGLPAQVREKYADEIPYSTLDKIQVKALEETAKRIDWDKVPGAIRYPKGAFDAFRREGRYIGVTDDIMAAGQYIGAKAVGNTLNSARSIRSLLPQ